MRFTRWSSAFHALSHFHFHLFPLLRLGPAAGCWLLAAVLDDDRGPMGPSVHQQAPQIKCVCLSHTTDAPASEYARQKHLRKRQCGRAEEAISMLQADIMEHCQSTTRDGTESTKTANQSCGSSPAIQRVVLETTTEGAAGAALCVE